MLAPSEKRNGDMTKDERQQYAREYRAEGFGKIADAKYYATHAEELRRKRRERYAKKR